MAPYPACPRLRQRRRRGLRRVEQGGQPGSPGDGGAADGGVTTDAAGGGSDAAGGGDGSARDAAKGDAAGVDASSDGGVATASHPAQPQVVTLNGTVLKSAKVQLIAYAEDTNLTDVEAMIAELSKTMTWAEQTSEYGVGPFTILPTIQIAGTPPATLDDNAVSDSPFQQTLVTNTTGTSPAWGAADGDTIYAFVIPSGTNVESNGSCCTDFYGYHYETAVTSSVSVPYAIVCTCNSPAGLALTQLENVTTTVSHELAEAATDPFPDTNPAWAQTDSDDAVWTFATGGEVADMCEFNADSNYTPPGSTYMVQRSWSNAAALAGTNPCVPVPMPTPYFDAIPVLPDDVTAYGVASKGVTIAVGASGTVDVDLFSTAPTSGPWKVTAYDLNDYLGNAANTTVSLDKTSGSNGDVLHLTITVKSADSTLGGEGFVLVSDLGGQENIAMGAVGN